MKMIIRCALSCIMLSSGIACQETHTEEPQAAMPKSLAIQKPLLRELTALKELYTKVRTLLSAHQENLGCHEIEQELIKTYEWLNETPLKKPQQFAQHVAAFTTQIQIYQNDLTPELTEHLTSLIMLSKLIHTQPKNTTAGCLVGASTLATLASLAILHSHAFNTSNPQQQTIQDSPSGPPAMPTNPHHTVSGSGSVPQPAGVTPPPKYTAAELADFDARIQTLERDGTLTPEGQQKLEQLKRDLEDSKQRLDAMPHSF
ncbi:MAG: hypothetical protein WCJ17_01690 [bacterium]